ncbi:MAG TPA: hypothetical protein VMS64_31615 [Candidatus Methylomirabilis sp.]|nr:hypothetical protein [Candidatus Methylomirabilis sp.]
MTAAEALNGFFDDAEAAFTDAVARAGKSVERHVEVARHPLRLRFAGAPLADAMMPALRHLETPPATPSLTVLVWDLRSTGVGLRPPPWAALPYFERANMRGFRDDRFVLVYDRGTRAFSAVDNVEGRAVHWKDDAECVSFTERAAPLRHLLGGWLQGTGLFITHASAVGRASGGVALSGRTGSGKSTTAALCGRSGLGYLGDDNIVVSASGEPRAYSLYGVAKLSRDTLPWFPDLSSAVANPERLDAEKALIFLDHATCPPMVREFPLRVLLLPRVLDECETRLRPVSGSAALRTLVPDTLFTILGNPGVTVRGLRRLVEALPCYELALGRDRARIPGVIAELLEHA